VCSSDLNVIRINYAYKPDRIRFFICFGSSVDGPLLWDDAAHGAIPYGG
jgi:hypothetical protein